MGTGNKLGTSPFEVCDLFKTSVCPLARVMRRELSKRGIDKLKVVYSKEIAIKNAENVVSSISFVPPVAGFMMAGEVIRDIIGG
jgi:tRNA A37 threonylcarbamoyladenosine dehydratase